MLLLSVLDTDAEVEGAPGAPLDVRCLDANKDYIIVTWKQPAVDGGNSILGYFVDRLVNMLLPVLLLKTLDKFKIQLVLVLMQRYTSTPLHLWESFSDFSDCNLSYNSQPSPLYSTQWIPCVSKFCDLDFFFW